MALNLNQLDGTDGTDGFRIDGSIMSIGMIAAGPRLRAPGTSTATASMI
jgi:hypothetical protein